MSKVETKKRHIGRNISLIRESREMKQEELANRIGTSQQMISKYEQSEELEEKVLEKISKGLGVEPEYILAYNPDSNAKTVNNFTGNDIKGGAIRHFNGDNYQFHVIDRLVESHKDQISNIKEVYERLITEKEKLIQELKGQK
jgi:transcriptional regulator with XRE-family HTH domain